MNLSLLFKYYYSLFECNFLYFNILNLRAGIDHGFDLSEPLNQHEKELEEKTIAANKISREIFGSISQDEIMNKLNLYAPELRAKLKIYLSETIDDIVGIDDGNLSHNLKKFRDYKQFFDKKFPERINEPGIIQL